MEDAAAASLIVQLAAQYQSAPLQEKETMRRSALPAAEKLVQSRLKRWSDEELLKVASRFAFLDHGRCQLSSSPAILSELGSRQDQGLQVDEEPLIQFFLAAAGNRWLLSSASGVLSLMAERLEVETLRLEALQSVVLCLAKNQRPRQGSETLHQAARLLVLRREELDSTQLCSLLFAAANLSLHVRKADLHAFAETFVQKGGFQGPHPLPGILTACSEARFRSPALLQAAAAALARYMPEMQPMTVMRCLRLLAKLKFEASEGTKQLLEERLSDCVFGRTAMSSDHAYAVGTLVWSTATLDLRPPGSWLDRICMEVVEAAEPLQEGAVGVAQMSFRELCSFLAGLGILEHPIPDPDKFFQVLERRLAEGSALDVASAASAFAPLSKANSLPSSLWSTLDDRSVALLPAFTSQGLCMVLHAFGKCRVPPRQLLPLALDEVVREPDAFNMRDVTELLWTAAMLKCSGKQTDAAVAALMSRCRTLLSWGGRQNVRDLASIAWSVATLEGLDSERREFVKEVAVAAWPAQAMSGIDIANILWASCRAGWTHPRLNLFTSRIEELAISLEPLPTTTILWSYGEMEKHPGIELMEALLSTVITNINQLAPQGVANAVWACGKLRHHPGPLIQALRADLRRRGTDYSLQDWSAIILALTDLGEDPKELLQMVHHVVEEQRIQPDAKFISIVLWSVAVFERFSYPVFGKMLRLLSDLQRSDCNEVSLTRIHQVHLLACLVGKVEPQDLNPAFCLRGEPQEWLPTLLTERNRSHRTHREYAVIRAALKRLNISSFSSYRVDLGGRGESLHLSLVLRAPWGIKRKVAVELVPPSRLTVNTHQLMAWQLYRTACLRACGFDVLWLPFSEWEMASAKGIQDEYLTSRLNKLVSGS